MRFKINTQNVKPKKRKTQGVHGSFIAAIFFFTLLSVRIFDTFYSVIL